MLTPMDIHNKTFEKGLRGYVQEEVDQFLQEVVNDYEKIYREHREMEEETDALRTKLKSYETMETTMTSTLMMAQETAENVKVSARKEAELIIAKAEAEREHMLQETATALRKAQERYDQIVSDINVFRAKMRSLLESELVLIDEMVPDRTMRVPDVPEKLSQPIATATEETGAKESAGPVGAETPVQQEVEEMSYDEAEAETFNQLKEG